MFQYLLEASLCWLAFYLAYALLLSRETFFQLNRWYLVGTLILGGIIPLIELPSFLSINQPAPVIEQWLPGLVVEEGGTFLKEQPAFEFNELNILGYIYWLGVMAASLRFLFGLWQLFALFQKSEKIHFNTYTLVLTNRQHLPFSFFNYLFKSRLHQAKTEDQSQITKHELAHIRGRHTFDVLLMELVGIIMWCSPPIYMYRRSLRVVHEYIADAAVLRTSNRKHYGQMLIRQSQSGLQIALVNHLIHSQLKKRIFMMTKDKSRNTARYKYLLLAPLLCLMLVAFARQNVSADYVTSTASDEATLPIASTTKGDVDEMPRFPGCEQEQNVEMRKNCSMKRMFQFIFENLKYPQTAKDANIEGTVVVQFYVDTDGSIIEPTIVKGLGSGCDEEVLRMMKEMPTWIPGIKDGKAVKVEMNLPIQFKLSDKETTKTKKDGKVFKVAEEMPIFHGCDERTDSPGLKKKCSDTNLLQFIFANIKYPKEAEAAGAEGMVVVSFIIDKSGKVVEPEIVRSVHPLIDKEVLRVIRLMPEWTPGKQEGKAVSVEYKLPIRFKFDDKKDQQAEPNANPAPKPTYAALELTNFSASPNPTDGAFLLRFSADPKPVTIRITNESGKELYKLHRPDFDGTFSEQIDLNTATKGTLIVTVQQGEKYYSSKVIMQ